MKAMILAAGLGTRLKPLTDKKPKALVEVNGLPLIDIQLQHLLQHGFKEIIVNVHHFTDLMVDHLKRIDLPGLRIEISHEKDLLDTGGGLKEAAWFFDDDKPFLLHNVDVLTNLDYKHLIDIHEKQNALATLAVRRRITNRYFLFDQLMKLCGWESLNPPEKKIKRMGSGELTQFSFMGVHVISPEIFDHLTEQGTFSIVKSYLDLADKNQAVFGYDASTADWLDVGKKESLELAHQKYTHIFR